MSRFLKRIKSLRQKYKMAIDKTDAERRNRGRHEYDRHAFTEGDRAIVHEDYPYAPMRGETVEVVGNHSAGRSSLVRIYHPEHGHSLTHHSLLIPIGDANTVRGSQTRVGPPTKGEAYRPPNSSKGIRKKAMDKPDAERRRHTQGYRHDYVHGDMVNLEGHLLTGGERNPARIVNIEPHHVHVLFSNQDVHDTPSEIYHGYVTPHTPESGQVRRSVPKPTPSHDVGTE